MKISDLHHVSLAVNDIAEAKHFYGTLLGFPELKRPDFDFPGAWYQVGTAQLHLIENKQAETLRHEKNIDSRDGHFAVRVDDYKQTVQFLQNKGIEIVQKPHSKSGFAQIFCMDPSNNLIEFNVDQKDLKEKE
ncbi:MAG: VOC family protein [Bacillota bacterium]|jgi:catechol 2,3-dioxygenase-like lactoylglutathione lyase family enzyme|uniref:VOC family protein n=1 Tax=Bacillus sp. RO2 TaxID=2723913 RepID=UPI00145E9EC7|nr:VOC family protein [Bacillus sp. RO2]MEA3322511.1 VOC family protein [Bacillota bacterium]NMH74166.1 glyoxalase [Bacillus sp. RO2]